MGPPGTGDFWKNAVMSTEGYEVLNVGGGRHVKMWTRGVPVDESAKRQLENTARMPFVFRHLAVMPDVHFGRGATVGSVIATKGAIIPAAVGVDIGCGMMAVQTTLKAADLPDSLARIRSAIERAVPHGFVTTKGRALRGSWVVTPDSVVTRWRGLSERLDAVLAKHPGISQNNPQHQLGTLGGGNHFIENCLDTEQTVWVMLHSGSRGIGNRIGQYFIDLARHDRALAGGLEPNAMVNRVSSNTLSRATKDEQGLRWVQAENRTQPENLVAQTGFMQGAAGVGTYFLQRHALESRKRWITPFPDTPWV